MPLDTYEKIIAITARMDRTPSLDAMEFDRISEEITSQYEGVRIRSIKYFLIFRVEMGDSADAIERLEVVLGSAAAGANAASNVASTAKEVS